MRQRRKDNRAMKVQTRQRFLAVLLGALIVAPAVFGGEGGWFGRRSAVEEEPKEEAAEEPEEAEVKEEPAPEPEKAPEPRPEPRRTRRRVPRGKDTPVYRRLYEAAEDMTLEEQARYQEADAFYRAGLAAYENAEYEKAERLFSKAVLAYAQHQGAHEMLQKTRSLLGIRDDRICQTLKRLSREKKARVQETLIELANAAERADKLVNESAKYREGDRDMAADEVITRQISLLNQAITQYNRVLEIIRWLPYGVTLPEEAKVVKANRAEAEARRRQLEENLRAFQREQAREQAEAARVRERAFMQERISSMMERAKLFYDRLEFEECESLCERILKIDPTYQEAEDLISKSRAKRHALFESNDYIVRRHERRSTMNNVEEATIPYSDRILYPSNWEEIVARADTAGATQTEEEAWVREIRRKLQERVSFEFVETPLSEAVQFLQNLTKVNMILDPQAIEEIGDVPITLRVTRMSLDLALGWILRLAGLQYALKDNAVFISRPENLAGDVQLKIYDVRDLTMKIQHFSGPDFAIEVGGSGGMGGGGTATSMITMIMEEGEETVTAASLADMIMARVKPEEWSPELGTSIEESGGKLVVMQRPEVHRLIDKLLSSLRATQKLQVTIDCRILLVRQGFFEEIGYEWSGLESSGLMGTGAGAGHEVVGGGTWPTPQSLDPSSAPASITPGYVRRPTGADSLASGGSIHIAGSIRNWRPEASPEEDTLGHEAFGSATWLDGLVTGLNAHYTYLSRYEAMLMMHLLRVRQQGTVLTAPRLTVLNTQRAHMFVAEQQAYIADYDVSGTVYDPVIRQFLQGVVFEVRPIVSSDRRYVTMELKPTTAELVEALQEIPLIGAQIIPTEPPIYQTIILPIYFPRLELRKLRTTLTVPDGGLILLGGLMKDVKYYAETGVPFISNLPIIGRLFRWSVEDNEKRNLYFMTRAKLLIFEEEERDL